MATADDTWQGVFELRNQAFRLADALAREATPTRAGRTGAERRAIDAATQMQSIAYLLGRIEQMTPNEGTG